MIVMKFGGTSIADAESIANAARIVTRSIDRKPLVVLSAGAEVTDALISVARRAVRQDRKGAIEEVHALRLRHTGTARRLLDPEHAERVTAVLDEQFAHLEKLVKGVAILQELTPRVLDHFMSFGEGWSCLLFEQKLLQEGLHCEWIDSREILITDSKFNKATPLFDVSANRARQYIRPLAEGKTVVVTQGFVGSAKNGITTTLGRGGSDYTAAILGSLLDAEEIQIWTDVSGILTAHPSIVPDARPVHELTFNEAAEIAYFGAKVLHPSTLLPAMKKNIPVRVLNAHRPDDRGTLITANGAHAAPAIPSNGESVVKSIAHRTGITIVRIQSSRMLMAHGFLARVFDIFARFGKSVDIIATSEVGISVTVDDATGLDEIVEELRQIAEVQVHPEKAVISIVGERMRSAPGVAGRAFTALGNAGISLDIISHGGSEINLTFVINQHQVKTALRILHEEFFGTHTTPIASVREAGHGYRKTENKINYFRSLDMNR